MHHQKPIRFNVQRIHLASQFLEELQERMVLVFTGQVRLASMVLQKVVTRHLQRDSVLIASIERLVELAKIGEDAFAGVLLNTISEQSNIFWHALCCVELLLKVLGNRYISTVSLKLILQNESLESKQTDYELQRRVLLYFLLQQVPHSSNFSSFIRKYAPQTAFNIVSRSYKMDPASPPFECLHFLGPTLLSVTMNTKLPPSLRQPAIELTEMILVADAAALAALYPETRGLENGGVEEFSGFSWDSFVQKIERDCESWHCTPLVWTEALQSSSLVNSSSFIKAFVWAVSRVSIFDQSVGGDSGGGVVVEAAMKWEKPRGCDDGVDGKACRNAVGACENLEELIRLFRRSADAFAIEVREQGFVADWQWEPELTEALLLLVMDSSKVVNTLGKEILGHFSKDNRFESGIRFICESEESLLYAFKSFRHVAKLLGSNPWKHTSSLQHVFFLALKLYTIGQACNGRHWKSFSQKLSPVLWPLLLHCITKGQQNSGVTGYETICIRVFELLPTVFKNMIPDTKQADELWRVSAHEDCPGWFKVLVSWSSTTSAIIRRRCISALVSILEDLARGAFCTRAGSSKTVTALLQSGSSIENDDRDRLSLLFSSPPKINEDVASPPAPAPAPPQLVIQLDSDDEDAPVAAEQLQKKKGEDIIVIPPPETPIAQHKRPVRFTKQQSISQHVFRTREEPTKEQQPRRETPRQQPEKAAPKAQDESLRAAPKAQDESPRGAPKAPEEPLRAAPKTGDQSQRDEQELELDERNAEDFLNELVSEDGPDHLESYLEAAKKHQRVSSAPAAGGPKRKLVRLDMPAEQMMMKPFSRNKGRAQRPAPPKMDDWLMRILGLDFFDNEESSSELSAVPTSFTSSEHYIEVFRPLLLEEFKAQLRRSHEELDAKDEETAGVVNLVSLERVDALHLAKFHSEAGKDRAARACMENDLVLLSKQPFEQCSGGLHMVAKVDRRENERGATVLKIKLYVPQTNPRLARAKGALVNRSKWHLTRLMSITPQMREFQAVSAMASSPFLDIVLSPKSNNIRSSATMPEPLLRSLSSDYDSSQLSAIKAALGDRRGGHQISLVQGPPGTGKTRTIVAIISALMCTMKFPEDNPSNNPKPSGPRRVSHTAAVAFSWQQMALAKQMEQDEQMDRGQKPKKNRVLVCAQSNAAVDELVARLLKDGIYNSSGQVYAPEIVRAGKASSVHRDSMPVFIDTIVERKLAAQRGNDGNEKNGAEDTLSLQGKLEQVSEDINQVACRIAAGESDPGLVAQKHALEKKRQMITMELSKSIKLTRANFEADRAKKKLLKNEAFREAEIVLTTLSGCGGDIYAACMESLEKGADVFFDAVVIDEAAQALEPATLIPLQLVATSQGRCVMVGDPKQLPATVLSQAANSMSFERSMFERFQINGYPVTMLNIQYRMHPEIRKFPSLYFYDDKLRDGEAVLGSNREACFHKDKLFPPYVFLDVSQGQETSGQSISNPEEAKVAVALYKCFKSRFSADAATRRIGVITPYKQQHSLLRNHFRDAFGEKILQSVEFNTIDGFQGREVDIVILSTVRARQESSNKSIGFVADIRRMNVALTRARFSLWIVGNARALKTNRAWAALLEDSSKRGAVSEVQKPYSTCFDSGSGSRGFSEPGARNRGEDARENRKRPGEAPDEGNKRQKVDSGRGGFRNQLNDRAASNAPGVSRFRDDQQQKWGSGRKPPRQEQQQMNSRGTTKPLEQMPGRGKFSDQQKPDSRGTKALDQQKPVSRGTGHLDQQPVQARGSKRLEQMPGGAQRPRSSQAQNGEASTSSLKRGEDDAGRGGPERGVVRNSETTSRKADDEKPPSRGGTQQGSSRGIDLQRRKKYEEADAMGFLLDTKKDFSSRKRPAGGVPPRKPNS